MMNEKELIEIIAGSQRKRNLETKSINEFFEEINLNKLRGKKVLDLGCGEGQLLFDLNNNYTINGTGVDLIALSESNENNNLKKNIRFFQEDISHFLENYTGEPFDFVYSFRVFMYMDYPIRIKCIKLIYEKILKIGGIALLDISGYVGENVSGNKIKDFSIGIEDIAHFKDYTIIEGINFYDIKLMKKKGMKIYGRELSFDRELALAQGDVSKLENNKIKFGVYDKFKYNIYVLEIIKKEISLN